MEIKRERIIKNMKMTHQNKSRKLKCFKNVKSS